MADMHWWQLVASSPLHRPWVGPRSDLQEMITALPQPQVDPAVKAFREKRRKAHRVARRQRAINRARG